MKNGSAENIAQDVVKRAVKAGVSGAEVMVQEEEEFSTTVRLGKIEILKEAASKGLGLRLLWGTRSASSYTSDFSPASLQRLVERTVTMAKATSEDPVGVLPDKEWMAGEVEDLGLYWPDVAELETDKKVELARRAEEAALAADKRITNSEGGSFESGVGRRVLANSLGFVGSYRSSSCWVTVTPLAEQDGNKQRNYWYSVSRSLRDLEEPEAVGRKAAERVLRRLGARKVETCQVPIIYDAETARSIVGHMFEAARGDAVYRSASFLTGKLGEKLGPEWLTIWDDGLRPGGFGSRPFDDEGVKSRVTPLVEKGVLRNYLLNCYSARKLGLKTTANARRGLSGLTSVGPNNLYLEPGTRSPEEMIRSVDRGFYVTELMGFGSNIVTGDYSRGAAGLWIEKGELTFPVEEVTIAGNLKQMYMNLEEVGNDLTFRGSTASPTLLITGMTVAGT